MVNASVIFDSFERMVAFRYLRARRAEGFVSVIAIFSLLGIALGVATLIIVMSVMNGFKVELLKSILGLSGHVTIQSQAGTLPGYDRVTGRILKVPGVLRATPIVDGKLMATRNGANEGAVVRGIRREDLAKITELNGKLRAGALPYFQGDEAVMGALGGPDQLVQLQLDGLCVAVLGILDEEDHQKRDDGRPRIDDQLPGVREMENRPGDSPDDDDAHGE